MTKDIYGHTSLKLLAYYDQESLSWKMSEGTSASDSKTFLKTLPKMGMMQDGKLYERAMLAHPIKEQDYSLLPTPKVGGQGSNPAEYRRVTPGLAAIISLLPTPTAMHVRNHDEPIQNYEQRVMDYNKGRTKGKPGASTGVAVRCSSKKYRIHWSMVN